MNLNLKMIVEWLKRCSQFLSLVFTCITKCFNKNLMKIQNTKYKIHTIRKHIKNLKYVKTIKMYKISIEIHLNFNHWKILINKNHWYFTHWKILINRAFVLIDPLHDPVTWYKITHAGEQVAQWDFQNKATRTSPP